MLLFMLPAPLVFMLSSSNMRAMPKSPSLTRSELVSMKFDGWRIGG